jgi:hypothetical protein
LPKNRTKSAAKVGGSPMPTHIQNPKDSGIIKGNISYQFYFSIAF